ncbi:homoserine kinase [Streptococcus gallolyticus]|uniref:Homoserine kinase n=1 Tax=Streptococcus gallolyticus TaxID=315405 RepID=A0A1I7HN33_9STRE|nr:homoserine kinase [Streptococcus gallolyticus]SFC20509.1 homoserine kinase [Streptococcus gallolyticus]SFU62157.1 homoserine kinase [Streptococcus gallolyticus]
MRITVPATSANVGPGFDSVGVAVSKYLTIEILEPSEKWEVLHDLGDVPSDETNLLITTALQVKADLQPHRIKMVSDIPLARGLGSSSSVIVAGIELANQLAHLQLSADEKLVIATKIEGHPDNVAPAIFGNLVISSYVDEKVNSAVAAFPEASFVAFIPNYELKTSDSRNVLPNEFSYKEAVAASSIANVAIAALLTGDLEKAGKAIEADLFHERFRQKLVKEFAPIKEAAHEVGAYATYLSGAGPTIMTLAPKAKEAELVERLEALALDGEVVALHVDTKGVFVEKD